MLVICPTESIGVGRKRVRKNYVTAVTCIYTGIILLVVSVLRAPFALRAGLWIAAIVVFGSVLGKLRKDVRTGE